MQKILVACPNHSLKEYAFQEWIDCVNKIDYPDYEIFVVDNSEGLGFYNRWKDKVPMVHVDLVQGTESQYACERINKSMAVIAKKFLEGDYAWWFNLESDVIIPPNGLNILLQYPSDWTSHGYPLRGGAGMMQGVGCSIFSRRLIEAYDFASAPNHNGPDAWLWEKAMKTHTTISLTGLMDVKHLGSAEGYGGLT